MIPRSVAGIVVASALLAGCVTLLPKAEPSSLYTLAMDAHPAEHPAGATMIGVLRGPTAFPRMSSGDQIVTVTGNEEAAIAGARWAAPAEVLFDEALATAFDASSKVRLATRGGPSASDHVLRVEVRSFEARYPSDPMAAPTVVIEFEAILTGPLATSLVKQQTFRAEVPAAANRVSSIVDAYNAATAKALGDLVTWTEGAAASP